ncbi:hypothetical protein HHX48_17610 [Salinimonas sp. HHU 13199]|uniref:Uncharacterized protein n=1 Tax=Salinimonas profundi TaxID=2729140 RepID=A0ABR8LUB7_9ALTE|nr:hypothetical protein [Salinimonas profundi]MBD3587559.1 hypothetical protein [Salinimonas profundi]
MSVNIEFDDNAIQKHWSMYPQLQSFFDRMSLAEVWVLDDEISVKARVANWVESLNETKLKALNDDLPSLLTVLAFQRVQSSMYLLQQLEKRLPGITNSLTFSANNLLTSEQYNRPAKILLERLAAAHTQVSLQELLNNERLALVYAALNNVNDRKGKML